MRTHSVRKYHLISVLGILVALSLYAGTLSHLSLFIKYSPAVDAVASSTHEDLGNDKNWIAFIYHGEPLDSPIPDNYLLSLCFARYANPDAPIVLLVDSLSRVKGNRLFFEYMKIEVVRMPEESRSAAFIKNYKHSSVNDENFEMLCFLRFLLLDNFVSSRKHLIDSIAHVDLDFVLLTSNKPPVPSFPNQAWAPLAFSTWFIRFTPTGLKDFANFIDEFYSREPDTVFSDLQRYGEKLPSGIDIESSISNWMPSYNSSKDMSPKHFSDMFILNAWVAETSLTVHIDSYSVGALGEELALIGACTYPEGFIDELHWKVTMASIKCIQYQVTLPGSSFPQWGLHFQNGCKKHMCDVLCKRILPSHREFVGCCN